MYSRSYLSGSAKRKLKKERDTDKKKKSGLIESFMKPIFEIENAAIPHVSDHETIDNNDECCSAVIIPQVSNIDSLNNISDKPTFKNLDSASDVLSVISVSESNEIPLYGEPLVGKMDASCSFDSSNNSTSPSSYFDSDPALWHDICDRMVEYHIKNPPPQNMHMLKETELVCGNVKRSLTSGNFFHLKKNGEKVVRKWLVLSATTKSLFCWVCKLFCFTSRGQLVSGFNDWKHASARLAEHENSMLHKTSIVKMSQRLNIAQRIDCSLIKQHEEEANYFTSVLRRVVAVVKFLAIRGLPFYGDNETIGSKYNGNFLGCLELISQFDPFLSSHLQKYGNPGKGNVSYLSSTTVDEFINIMAEKVTARIIEEISSAKYFSLILDSTPDVTHLDQLCFVLRYVCNAQPVERFLKFVPITSHKSESLADVVLKTLTELDLDMSNCRGQSYDNASNMAGKYSGLQARLKSLNPVADFIPCAAHSLNLVGVNAVESCSFALQFFSLVQQVYNFFSASTNRWQYLSENIRNNGESFTLKSCSSTRWCADAQAVKSLRKNYTSVLQTLTSLSTDNEQNASTILEASSLHKKLQKFETVLNIVVWDTLLQRLNQTSIELQKPTLNILLVGPLYRSLIDFTQTVRDNFSMYENEAKSMCGDEVAYCESVRKKVIPKSKDPHAIHNDDVCMTSRETYIFKNHFPICDSLISHLTSRKLPYDELAKKFACFYDIKNYSVMNQSSKFLQEYYSADLEDCFTDELQQFSSLIDNEDKASFMLEKLKSFQLEETFPNVETALRIMLTLPISNCSGERSFSLLKRLKSPIRSSLLQGKLCSLSLMCIEADLTNSIEFENVVTNFAKNKLRKRCITKINST